MRGGGGVAGVCSCVGESWCVDLLFGGGDVLSVLGDMLLFLFPFPLCLGVEVRGTRDLCAVFGVDVSWSRDLIFSKLMGAKINKN